MPAYRTNEALFEVPDSWTDQTIVAFRIPAPPGGQEASFVVTRDPGLGAKKFERYVSDQEAQCRKSLPKFEFRKSDRLEVRGR
ncbi:MAG: DcrB-related protein [Pseudomonadota bacterium]